MSRRYALDANAFIEAKNRYYSFDICPGFWSSLDFQHATGRVFSVDRIADELKEQDDKLKEWVDDVASETFFKKTEDQAVIDTFQLMVKWVYAQTQFWDAAKAEFASVADGWCLRMRPLTAWLSLPTRSSPLTPAARFPFRMFVSSSRSHIRIRSRCCTNLVKSLSAALSAGGNSNCVMTRVPRIPGDRRRMIRNAIGSLHHCTRIVAATLMPGAA